MRLFLISTALLATIVTVRADELNDMPDLACAQASSELERQQIGCSTSIVTPLPNQLAVSPLDRSEPDDD